MLAGPHSLDSDGEMGKATFLLNCPGRLLGDPRATRDPALPQSWGRGLVQVKFPFLRQLAAQSPHPQALGSRNWSDQSLPGLVSSLSP